MQKLLFSDEEELPRPVNVASVPQRSPFRYPGGKTWFVPRLRDWLSSRPDKPARFIEPFVGGGIISLTVAFENLANSVLMAELDEDVAAVWETVVSGESSWLAKQILNFDLTKESVIKELSIDRRSVKQKAFQTILKNRTFHGGIMATGSGFVKNGEAGKGISSRWYPSTLSRRFRDIELVSSKMDFQRRDAMEVLIENCNDSKACFFIDPPYTAGGKRAGNRLYKHHELDHEKLFEICANLAGDFIMTYDNAEEVKSLARQFALQVKPIAMKNTHHAEMTELVIGRDLSWMNDTDRVCEESTIYRTQPHR